MSARQAPTLSGVLLTFDADSGTYTASSTTDTGVDDATVALYSSLTAVDGFDQLSLLVRWLSVDGKPDRHGAFRRKVPVSTYPFTLDADTNAARLWEQSR